jgi:hypothetical protein
MAYSNLSIKTLISDISLNKYYLPAIQRKFVWNEDKICKLFNSIMQDYPIGTFLFWDLPPETANRYTFYEFLKNYHERDSKNDLVKYDFPAKVRGVLDGQQRISSMYIALQGVFCTKKKYAKTSNNNAYLQRKMYINLISKDYDFKFLTEEGAKSGKHGYFYLVRNVLHELKDADSDEIVDKLIASDSERAFLLQDNRKIAKRNINRLINKFNDDQLVSYFRIVDKELDDILDIFVRVNSGGTILSKSDLLFSTLVAHWEDGREQIEQLITDMNGQDGLFSFNTDFLMRTCLFLVDAPMNFKLQTFDAKNINKIKDNWPQIRKALITAAGMMRDFGFNKARLSSNYAVTPIAYYLYKGGVVDNKTKPELKKLVIHSLLKQVYSGQADSALGGLREGLREGFKVNSSDTEVVYKLKSQSFSFIDYQHTRLSGGKRLTIDTNDIDGFLEHKKGAFTFLLLSVLYPDLKLGQISFHQDHMHPHSKFKPADLKEFGLDLDAVQQWLEMRDQLPNLQLLEGQENVEKQAVSLEEWVKANSADDNYYRSRNFVPLGQSLALKDFEDFFVNRRELLSEALHKLFGAPQLEKSVREID